MSGDRGVIWNDWFRGYTPTQRAASIGDIKALRMLLDRGTSVNEAPDSKSGRTALQAAALLKRKSGKMAIIDLLLDRGANINAEPAAEGGVTALQAAAIVGDLMLAKCFITRGANVNAWPSAKHGRTAIEGAAEHGRLDMVQLLLNAGAVGNIVTGFKHPIELAESNGHFTVAKLLKEASGGSGL
ncbi:ankyrin repeat domain-containing protein 50 [Staphylotrichum tortipilum]|uniref:Ankyrin repeat domain-containing protein 50 n=1 Tax=Staphylotrichum tortipilum TaxID=2831512 RepID=A0AAN6RSH2_9PEZI|nr:ankyrin repeat domain-containing protein 50 [Staphylotrichum longicolle]